MKIGIIFLFVSTGLSVGGLPVNDKAILSSSCIEMTPAREQEIHKIVEEVNEFIEILSDKHEDIDFTLVKLKIEKHSDNDEKETVLKIVINDCKNAGTKTRKAKYLESNFVSDDNSKLAEESSSEEKIEYSDSKSVVENYKSDFENNSESLEDNVSNNKIQEKRSKINENTKSEKETKQQSKTKEESGEESSQGINNKNESRDKTDRYTIQDEDIKILIKDLNDNQHFGDSDNGVYIFAPTIDNSKVKLSNHYHELYKDLYNSAIQKLANLETELEKLKQAKSDSELSNIKDLFNKFDKNVINPFNSFGFDNFVNYRNPIRSNNVYRNRDLELIYF